MPNYQYFTLAELIKSSKASQEGIDNIPSFEVVEHLSELVSTILEPLRVAWGAPIFVRSGFRSILLNQVVGGVKSSAHPLGFAADLQVNGSIREFYKFFADWLLATGTKFDQLIIETDGRGTQWVHIGLYNCSGQQRGQIMELSV